MAQKNDKTNPANEVLSLLFASATSISEEDLMKYSSAKSKMALKKALEEAEKKIEGLPFQLYHHQRAWKLTLKSEYLFIVKNLSPETELTKGALDVLALIAYNEPVVQSEIINKLGTGAYEHVKSLIEHNFIERTPKGRSFTLKLGDNFFRYFEISKHDAKKIFEAAGYVQQKTIAESINSQRKNEPGYPEGHDIRSVDDFNKTHNASETISGLAKAAEKIVGQIPGLGKRKDETEEKSQNAKVSESSAQGEGKKASLKETAQAQDQKSKQGRYGQQREQDQQQEEKNQSSQSSQSGEIEKTKREEAIAENALRHKEEKEMIHKDPEEHAKMIQAELDEATGTGKRRKPKRKGIQKKKSAPSKAKKARKHVRMKSMRKKSKNPSVKLSKKTRTPPKAKQNKRKFSKPAKSKTAGKAKKRKK